MTIEEMADILGGHVVSDDSLRCPGPGEDEGDTSLSVTIADGDFILCHSFKGVDGMECWNYVRDALGISGQTFDRSKWNTPEAIAERKESAIYKAWAREVDSRLAVEEFWDTADPVMGDLGITYLASRGVSYCGDALRWCHRVERIGGWFLPDFPCIVALVRNILTDKPQGTHRTILDTGRPRIMKNIWGRGRRCDGTIKGGAVKLTAHSQVTTDLCIGEGIETSLSFPLVRDAAGNHPFAGIPIWSVLNANGVKDFPALPGLKRLIIAADNDKPDRNGRRAGIDSANEARARLEADGIEVRVIMTQKEKTDLNDMVKPRGR